MKKIMTILATTFLLIFSNSFLAFAASASNEENNSFAITGGINFSKESESTFDKTRTIVGKAEEKSIVTVTVYEKLLEKQEELKEIEKYKIVVGASGYFSQTINLSIGENVVEIKVKDIDKKSSSISTSITRKKSEIKNELEQAIILPRNRK